MLFLFGNFPLQQTKPGIGIAQLLSVPKTEYLTATTTELVYISIEGTNHWRCFRPVTPITTESISNSIRTHYNSNNSREGRVDAKRKCQARIYTTYIIPADASFTPPRGWCTVALPCGSLTGNP